MCLINYYVLVWLPHNRKGVTARERVQKIEQNGAWIGAS